MNMMAVKNICYLALLLFFLSGIVSCSSTSKIKIEQIKRTGDSASNSKALVFVHGVLGSGEDTWTHSSASKSWPQLIADDEQYKYDIYVVSYRTSIFDESPVIFQLGTELNQTLTDKSILPKNIDTPSNYEQVIFVAHSMGNLVVQSTLVAGDSALELRVPLLLSIAAPWEGSDLADKASLIFRYNPQFRDMVKLKNNSFLQLLQHTWAKRRFPINIKCASEGQEYTSLLFWSAMVVNADSAGALCLPEDREPFSGYDHSSIVKPENLNQPIHKWLNKHLNDNEGHEMPWKLGRWEGKAEEGKDGEQLHVCEIKIAGKDFLESNILMQMMVLVIEDRIRQVPNQKCTDTEKNLQQKIKVVPLFDHGNGPSVISDLRHSNIDIYAEYSGALLYSYLNYDIPDATTPKSDEVKRHEIEYINTLMSSHKYPDFNKMKLLPRFGFDSGIELVMLKTTAERLQMIKEGDTTVTYDKIIKHGTQLAFLGDRDLFTRRDALGGLKAQKSPLSPGLEVPLFHETIYSELDKTDCNQHPGHPYCQSQSPLKGAVAIGFKTDPQAKESKYVKIVGSEKFELPRHWASPMVHSFLEHAFPELKLTKTLEKLKGAIDDEQMRTLINDAKKLPQDPDPEKKETFRLHLRDLVQKYLIKNGVIGRRD